MVSFLTSEIKAQISTANITKQWAFESISDSLSHDEEFLYILDGVILSSEEIDKKLNQYDFKTDKLAIEFLSKSLLEANTIFCSPPKTIILINDFTKNQNRKSQLESLQKALSFFKEPALKTAHGQLFNITPTVLFDGIKLAKDQTHSFLSQLKPSDIDCILVSKHGPSEFLGQDTKNGLIRIWLKK